MYFKYTMKRNVLQFIYEFLIVTLVWGSVWSIAGVKALPGGPIFNLFALFVLAVILGRVVAIGNNVPPLIGMLLAGFILRNAFPSGFDISFSLPFYRFARGVVLIRAGLLLNANLLKNNIRQCLRLVLLPCFCEATVIAIGAHLFGVLKLEWGYLLGFAVASVSPAVIVPSFFKLKQRNFKLDKGIDTIVIAASTIENVSAIALFGIVLSVIFSSPQRITIWALLEGPMEICIGLVYGVICGLILWFIPQENAHNVFKRIYSIKRFVIIVLFGAFASFGSGKAGFRFAGSLACVVEAFVAAMKWKEYYSMKFVEQYLKSLWTWFCEPLLFAMIGAEMKLSYLEEEDVECLVLCVITALLFRITTVFFVSWGMKFDVKERLFVAISAIPKATVQASLAPIALQYSRQLYSNSREFERQSTLVLAAAVLSIVITAPIGAFAINYSAPKLLHKNDTLFTTEETDFGFSLVSSLLTKNKGEEKSEHKNYGTVNNNISLTTNC